MENKIQLLFKLNRRFFSGLAYLNFALFVARLIYYNYHYGLHLEPFNQDELFYTMVNNEVAKFTIMLAVFHIIGKFIYGFYLLLNHFK